MKVFIIIFITVALNFISCKENYSELIQKIELTQTALLQQDSILIAQRNTLSSLVYSGSNSINTVNSEDTNLTNLVSKQNSLITRIQLIIQKNKQLIIELNNNTTNPNEVYKNYAANADELELMKTEIYTTTINYTKLVEQNFKNVGDSIK